MVGTTGAANRDTIGTPAEWRAERRLIDVHQHVNSTTQHLTRAVKIMDAAGVGMAVNLGVGTVTPARTARPPHSNATGSWPTTCSQAAF